MSPKLQTLLKSAQKAKMTPDQREKQRRSFAYGNTKIENDRITRTIVDRAAKSLAGEKPE
jgi:hypothetical protein